MPLDAMTLAALAAELEPELLGMRIDKIRSPERDMLVFNLRGPGGGARLLVSAGPGGARVHLTRAEFENPQSPPMFCMLLRKHLQGGRVAGVVQPQSERVLALELDSANELGDISRKRLVVELIGKSANIILVGSDGRIIDCLRRVEADSPKKRPLLPGLFYSSPPRQLKPDFLSASSGTRAALWEAADTGLTADRWLLDCFAGISPLICRELCHRAFGEASPLIAGLAESARAAFPPVMDALCKAVENREFSPVLLTLDEKPFDFSFLCICQYGAAVRVERAPSFSVLLDTFYTRRDKASRLRAKAADITRTVKSARERVARRLAAQKSELMATKNRDELKMKGDLITSGMHRLSGGMTRFYAENFYLDGCPETLIELDPRKSPSQNAASYYRAYNKAKNAESCLTALIAKGEEEYEYLGSVLEETERAESESDLREIRAELSSAGFIKNRGNPKPGGQGHTKSRGKSHGQGKKRGDSASAPRKFISGGGFEILAGRSNAQNDELTMKTARKSDLWLHAHGAHGAHVIILCGGREPDEQTILEAASIAAWYSELRGSAKAPVDYTFARHVKKPSGAMPGKVLYTDYKTLIVSPREIPGN